jgi:hypothetical protein
VQAEEEITRGGGGREATLSVDDDGNQIFVVTLSMDDDGQQALIASNCSAQNNLEELSYGDHHLTNIIYHNLHFNW